MKINQNILATLRTFAISKNKKKQQQKTKNYETLYIKETASKALSCYY